MRADAAQPAIRIERLGKSYRIGHLERADTLREAVQNFITAPRARLRRFFSTPTDQETIWALRDVSFELEHGQVLGIIGPNGAGKSTLLKILSRITDPTEGYADVWGRLASLLEIGTGFHQDLTGRDNVYLNGAILGMRRAEIAAKFDQIVEFAGVEKFIDTPVKRYSSGMYMRLAFAVAAHLDPDILIVDEVLSVGDAEFQARSLGKMREVSGQGRTVLFVSHNMSAIRTLCDRAILLNEGRVAADGAVEAVVTQYLAETVKASASGDIAKETTRIGSGEARLVKVVLNDRDGQPLHHAFLGQPVTVVLTARVSRKIRDAVFELGISTVDGVRVTTSFSTDGNRPPYELEAGMVTVSLDLDLVLLPGHYTFDLGLHHAAGSSTMDFVEHVLDVEVLNISETGDDSFPVSVIRGYVRPPGRWGAAETAEDAGALRVG